MLAASTNASTSYTVWSKSETAAGKKPHPVDAEAAGLVSLGMLALKPKPHPDACLAPCWVHSAHEREVPRIRRHTIPNKVWKGQGHITYPGQQNDAPTTVSAISTKSASLSKRNVSWVALWRNGKCWRWMAKMSSVKA